MSSTIGTVYDKNKNILGYFEYYGTTGYALTAIKSSKENIWKYLHDFEKNCGECKCNQPDQRVPVILYIDYGNGFDWESEICSNCMVITGDCNSRRLQFPGKYYQEIL